MPNCCLEKINREKKLTSNSLRQPFGIYETRTERIEIRTMDDLRYVRKRFKWMKEHFQSKQQSGDSVV